MHFICWPLLSAVQTDAIATVLAACYAVRLWLYFLFVSKPLCSSKNFEFISDEPLTFFYNRLCELLHILKQLSDLLVQDTLKSHWALYRRLIRNAHANPEQYGCTLDELKTLQTMMERIDVTLFTERIVLVRLRL